MKLLYAVLIVKLIGVPMYIGFLIWIDSRKEKYERQREALQKLSESVNNISFTAYTKAFYDFAKALKELSLSFEKFAKEINKHVSSMELDLSKTRSARYYKTNRVETKDPMVTIYDYTGKKIEDIPLKAYRIETESEKDYGS